jgi:hypothetical protein
MKIRFDIDIALVILSKYIKFQVCRPTGRDWRTGGMT